MIQLQKNIRIFCFRRAGESRACAAVNNLRYRRYGFTLTGEILRPTGLRILLGGHIRGSRPCTLILQAVSFYLYSTCLAYIGTIQIFIYSRHLVANHMIRGKGCLIREGIGLGKACCLTAFLPAFYKYPGNLIAL